MILSQVSEGIRRFGRNFTLAALALSLAACAQMDENDAIGSHLAQPPAGTPQPKPIEAGDIAIVGQEVSHAIMALPAIADTTVQPLVRFTEVTSIIDKPIDTRPYTQLLRDRLLLLTREKLRFVERTLPPYRAPGKKGKKAEPEPVENGEAQYQILAELRGHADADFYKIQVQFIDLQSNEVLFDGLYRIRPEASSESPSEPEPADNQPPPDTTVPPAPAVNGAL